MLSLSTRPALHEERTSRRGWPWMVGDGGSRADGETMTGEAGLPAWSVPPADERQREGCDGLAGGAPRLICRVRRSTARPWVCCSGSACARSLCNKEGGVL